MNLFGIVDVITKWRAYVAAVGLIGLSVYQFSQADFAPAIQSLMTGLAAFGVGRNEVAFTQLRAAHQSLLLQMKSKE